MLITPREWLADQMMNTFKTFDEIKSEFLEIFPESSSEFESLVNEIEEI